jgi:hypothetical protein
MDKVLEGIKVFFSTRVLRPAVLSVQPPIYWVLVPVGLFHRGGGWLTLSGDTPLIYSAVFLRSV